jgi:hypothetical protein
MTIACEEKEKSASLVLLPPFYPLFIVFILSSLSRWFDARGEVR